ncbi:hypothetical protein D910_11771 [Dendroctonus ponderosae]|uniref:Uncharacterized protein n=1 Tax=Dendroctonus ponderosae TaxID=77166 RepID=U4UK88_DENPD|nr:hypothetical protein D910_11771 [Dendroctonus ponderosae]
MSRLNGRLASAPPQDPNQDFEPSCLVRTPSGNVYIPSGTLTFSKPPLKIQATRACETSDRNSILRWLQNPKSPLASRNSLESLSL